MTASKPQGDHGTAGTVGTAGTGGTQDHRDSPRYTRHPHAVGNLLTIGQDRTSWRVAKAGAGWVKVQRDDAGVQYPARRLAVPSSLRIAKVSTTSSVDRTERMSHGTPSE